MPTVFKASPIRALRRPAGELFDVLFVPAVLLLLVCYLTATNDSFLSRVNIMTVLSQASILAIVAFAMTFVIMAGELDLSIGAASALMSVIAAMVMVETGSILAGFAAALVAGLVMGLVNGALVAFLQVPSFIATLGTMIICQAAGLALTDGGIVTGLPAGFSTIALLRIAGIPVLVLATAVIFLAMWWLQRQTTFGYRMLAVGGNAEAARLSGISVRRIRLLVFVVTGVAGALAALALLVRVQSGQPNANGTLALEAIAAVVVGGTSLTGGRGSVTRTLWGVLLIVVLRNGLDISGISEDYKNMVLGVVFILAASVDFLRRKLVRTRIKSDVVRSDAVPPAGRPVEDGVAAGQHGSGRPVPRSADLVTPGGGPERPLPLPVEPASHER